MAMLVLRLSKIWAESSVLKNKGSISNTSSRDQTQHQRHTLSNTTLPTQTTHIMADVDDGAGASGSEPLDLVRMLLDEIVFVKLRGDRELKGRLHVRALLQSTQVSATDESIGIR